MSSIGPTIVGTGVNIAGGGASVWNNPDRITADDANESQSLMIGGGTTQYLKGTMGARALAVPGGSTIDGWTVEWERNAYFGTGTVADNEVFIVRDDAIETVVNRAIGGNWPAATPTWQSYGGPTDLWGVTWTVAQANAATMGSIMRATGTGTAGAGIDACRITVNYSVGAAGGVVLFRRRMEAA